MGIHHDRPNRHILILPSRLSYLKGPLHPNPVLLIRLVIK
jgi:hypothetical protein